MDEATNMHLESFLEQFRACCVSQKPLSLLEIAGVNRQELVASNVLAFFLDPRREHGSGDVTLRSMAEALRIESRDLSTVSVEREVSCEENGQQTDVEATGGRLDLLIIGTDFVLGMRTRALRAMISFTQKPMIQEKQSKSSEIWLI